MPSFGANFINVATDPNPAYPAAVGENVTRRLSAMFPSDPSQPGSERTLWFPPGRYRVNAPFPFPPTVTLSFAPGALLIPVAQPLMGGGIADRVEIAGVVDAPLTQIFDASASGRIVFTGDGTARVFPEWWGAAQNPAAPDARVDTAAIQAAFRAAVIDREALATSPLSTVTVCLLNDYRLDGAVVVAPASGGRPLNVVAIAGVPGRRLRGLDVAPPAPPALLEIRRALQVTVRDLSVEAGGSWETCLSVSCDLARDARAHQVTLVDCSFSGARGAQATLTDLAVMPPTVGELKALVRGCHFAVDDARHTDFEAPPIDADAVARGEDLLTGQLLSRAGGLAVRAPFGADLAVDASEFRGFLRRGVRATGGVRAVVTGCSFRFQDRPDNVFPNGAAVALERAGVPRALLPSVQATSCVAMTPSFLWVDAPNEGDLDKSPDAVARGTTAVLTSITHRVDRSRGLGMYWPPAVVWRGNRPLGLTNLLGKSTLTLVGCDFEVPTSSLPAEPASLRAKQQSYDATVRGVLGLLPRIPRVFVNSDLLWVYNLGTFRDDTPSPVIGSFDDSPRTQPRTLGNDPSRSSNVWPPVSSLLPLVRDPFFWNRVLFAWADWSDAPALLVARTP